MLIRCCHDATLIIIDVAYAAATRGDSSIEYVLSTYGYCTPTNMFYTRIDALIAFSLYVVLMLPAHVCYARRHALLLSGCCCYFRCHFRLPHVSPCKARHLRRRCLRYADCRHASLYIVAGAFRYVMPPLRCRH